MKNNHKKRTTVHIDEEIWNIARAKAKCSGSQLVEELLTHYIGNDWDMINYDEKIEQSEEIIKNEKAKIKHYKKLKKDLEKEMEENAKNTIIIADCVERIKRYYSYNNFISFNFLLKLSRVKKVSIEKLNNITLSLGYEIKNIDDE